MLFLKIIFTLNLCLLTLDHLYTGSLALFFPAKAVRVYSELFGAKIPETREYFAILKPWGALGIFAGLVSFLPIFYPEKYILVIVALIILLLMRLFYRLKFQGDVEQSIGLTKMRNLRHIGLIIVCMSVMAMQVFYYSY